ncbi:MAG: hypothetical protein U1E46_15730 [Hyphomicrobiales bacterium]
MPDPAVQEEISTIPASRRGLTGVTPANQALARQTYARFWMRTGATLIASRYSLAQLAQIVSDRKPARVLEIGAGIGTVTHLLLSHPQFITKLVSVEDNAFCRSELAKNITFADWRRWSVVRSATQIDPAERFDLIVFDGFQYAEDILDRLSPGVTCFVDGNRASTRRALEQGALARGLAVDMQPFCSGPRVRMRKHDNALGFALRLGTDTCWSFTCRNPSASSLGEVAA